MAVSVYYLMTRPPHLPYLAVSLRSLRKCWSGPVKVFAYPESIELTARLCADSRLDIECNLWSPPYRGKNDQEVNKIEIGMSLSDEWVIYLDADTLIQRSPSEMIDAAGEFTATQFCDWNNANRRIRGRIEGMSVVRQIDQQAVGKALKGRPAHPSVNSGVFAARPGTSVLQTWRDWTHAARRLFIAGETTLHAIAEAFDTVRIAGGQWNCSPKFQPKAMPDAQVAIWHGHGDTFSRPEKCLKGASLWLAEWRMTLKENPGGIADWWRECGNGFVAGLIPGSSVGE